MTEDEQTTDYTRADYLLWLWGAWPCRRRALLLVLLAVVLYLNADDVGPRVPRLAAARGR